MFSPSKEGPSCVALEGPDLAPDLFVSSADWCIGCSGTPAPLLSPKGLKSSLEGFSSPTEKVQGEKGGGKGTNGPICSFPSHDPCRIARGAMPHPSPIAWQRQQRVGGLGRGQFSGLNQGWNLCPTGCGLAPVPPPKAALYFCTPLSSQSCGPPFQCIF